MMGSNEGKEGEGWVEERERGGRKRGKGMGGYTLNPALLASSFVRQICTAIIPSYITFQNNQKKIFHPKQM